MGRLDLIELASELLVQSAEALAANEAGAPERQVITIGAPALDCCPQLAVNALDLRFGAFGEQGEAALAQACHRMTMAGLRVTLAGCVPTVDGQGRPPEPTPIIDASTALYEQAWTLWCGLLNRVRAGDLFADPDYPERSIIMGPLTPLPEQGGCAGWTIDFAVQLNPDRTLGAAEGS